MFRFCLFVLLLCLTAVAPRAEAIILDFTAFSMGPTSDGVLKIGDLTITSSFAGTQPTIAAGKDLGPRRSFRPVRWIAA
jgi:hypothetical protein